MPVLLRRPPDALTGLISFTSLHPLRSFFLSFNGCIHSVWKFPGQGTEPKPQLWPTPQVQQQILQSTVPHQGSNSLLSSDLGWCSQILNPLWHSRNSWKPSIYIFFFLWPHLQHMKVLRLGVESELQLPAHITAIAIPDLSCIYKLCRGLWQCWILNPLKEAKDQTCLLMDTMSSP